VDDGVAVAVAAVELDGELALLGEFGAEPQAVAQQHRLVHAAAAGLDLRQPAARGGDDLGAVGRAVIEGEAAAVGDDGLEADGVLGGLGEGVGEGLRIVAGGDAAAADALGHGLDAHDLARRHAGEAGDTLRRQDVVGAEAGVDQQQAVVAGLHEALVDLGGAERGAALDVLVGIGEGLEVEQRRAMGADGEAEGGIEMAGAGGSVDETLGDQLLELRAREVARHQAVAVVVDEREVDFDRHCGTRCRSRPA
jgi:hypothetical protein